MNIPFYDQPETEELEYEDCEREIASMFNCTVDEYLDNKSYDRWANRHAIDEDDETPF